MKILFIADIVGKAGRGAVRGTIPNIKGREAQFIIANGENAAGGIGITPKIARELFAAGIDVITTGNHIFRRKEIIPYLASEKRVLRPANIPLHSPGKGWAVFPLVESEKKIGIINLLGRVFMEWSSNPFDVVGSIVEKIQTETRNIFVDFHAEATAEKMAMMHYLDGKVTAVIGTHTHIQTSDEMVSPHGTAYITDCGMTGPVESVIGLEKKVVLKWIETGVPQKFKPATGKWKIEGVFVEFNPLTGRADSIERLRITQPETNHQNSSG